MAELISKYNYWKENNKLTKEGYFYATIQDLKHETTLTKYRQTKAINNLKDLALIKTKKRGLPAKRYFTICIKEIKKLFFDIETKQNKPKNSDNPCHSQEVKNSKTCDGKTGKLDVENSPQIITDNKNKKESKQQLQQQNFKNNNNIYQIAKDNGFNLTPSIIECLDNLCNNYNIKLVKMALYESSINGKPTIIYARGILKNWKKNKITLSETNPFYEEKYSNNRNSNLSIDQLEEKGWN